MAAGGLASFGRLRVFTAIDERSAAFFAVGISNSFGRACAVITTSGTAVANLLPAAVEADRSSIPLLLITADRPYRLKNCGANQTLNQEDFLLPVCRFYLDGPKDGIHSCDAKYLTKLVDIAWEKAHHLKGPVHLNIAFEEPLHPSSQEQKEIWNQWQVNCLEKIKVTNLLQERNFVEKSLKTFPDLDHSKPGVVIVGPWRGSYKSLEVFNKVLNSWHSLSGWPIFADPLSGLASKQEGCIHYWDSLLHSGLDLPKEGLQVLRLGPMPVSRILEDWLLTIGCNQLLITEGESRNLDPLGLAIQWSSGFVNWFEERERIRSFKSESVLYNKSDWCRNWFIKDEIVKECLDELLPLHGPISEPALARWLPRILPKGLPIMMSASSPIRDCLTYSGESKLSRRYFSFRGASGIDGTLSLASGLAIHLGPLLLVTGDLAFLHDTNGWLLSHYIKSPLVVLLIDNGGGGIFRRLSLESSDRANITELFEMPQRVDHFQLVKAYGVPNRQVSCLEDLETALEWAFSKSGPVLLRVSANPSNDFKLRNKLLKEIQNAQ